MGMQLGRLIPSCLTNKSEDQPTNDNTGDAANVHKCPTISELTEISARRWRRNSARFGSRGVEPLHRPFRDRERVLEIAICGTPTPGTGASVPAQVRTFHFLVCAERVAFIMQNDSAGLKDVTVMGNLQCEISVLFDEENRDA